MKVLANVLLLLGSGFCLTAALGMFRLSDSYARMHAGTKCLTAGATLVLSGLVCLKPDAYYAGRAVLLLVFLFLSSPVATHALARACYWRNVQHLNLMIDEYQEYHGEEEVT